MQTLVKFAFWVSFFGIPIHAVALAVGNTPALSAFWLGWSICYVLENFDYVVLKHD